MSNIYSFLVTAAQRWPEHIAIVDEMGSITYADLFRKSEELRLELLKKSQNKLYRLALSYGNDRHFLISLFAAVGADFVVMPIYTELTDAEVQKQLLENEINYFLNPSRGEQLTDAAYKLEFLSDKEDANARKLCDDPAFIRPTSGTTGRSKGVLISHRAVNERTAAANKELCLTDEDAVVWVLPMAFHFVVSLVLYVRQGAKVIVAKGLDAAEIEQLIIDHKGTLLYSSPVHIQLMSHSKSSVQLPSLKRVISTTSSISSQICNAFYSKYKVPVSQAYGIIEVGLPIINTKSNKEEPNDVGTPLRDYEVLIADDAGNPLPVGVEGNLGIRGVGMFSGYLNPLTPVDSILQMGFFMTGDIAVRNEAGSIRIVGRKKSMINVGGNKVFPQEVEFVLERNEAVQQARVFAGSHRLIGEIVEAEVILKPDCSVDQEALISFCRNALAAYKIPQRIHFVDFILKYKTSLHFS